jgi:hypothetical protein
MHMIANEPGLVVVFAIFFGGSPASDDEVHLLREFPSCRVLHDQ